MGMYNEVFKMCPKCNETCCIQISQIVLGFGGFDLNRPSTLEELTVSELQQLKAVLVDEQFYCTDEDTGCGNTFSALGGDETEKLKLIDELTGGG